jgi:hypothetical protein
MFEHKTFSSKPNWTSTIGHAEQVVLDSDAWPLIQPAIHDAQGGFSSPFGATDPVIRYDRPLGWVEPVRDHGAGASNEWLTLSNALAVTDGEDGRGIAWTSRDSAMFAVGDVVRGAMPSSFTGHSGHILAFLMNNFWPCNTPPIQEGRVSFRFAFTAIEQFDSADVKRFGAQERVVAGAVHILALDRFVPDEIARVRRGPVIAIEEDGAIDRHIEECADGTYLMTTTNLTATPQSTSIGLGDPGGHPIALPGFGFARTQFQRGAVAGAAHITGETS